MFITTGCLSRLVQGESGPEIQLLDQAGAFGHLIRVADWITTAKKMIKNAKPSQDVAKDYLINPEPTLPKLDAVVSTPIFDEAGTLISLL